MVITYYGAACFKVQSGETVLAFDPPAKESSFKSPRFQADVVLVSVNAKDYNGWESLSGKGDATKPFLIDGKGEYEIGGVYVKGFGVSNDLLNTIYTVSLEDISICHFGAYKNKESDAVLKGEMGEVDILFMPIGGGDTIDPQKAAAMAAHIEPKIVIPMHYNDAQLKQFLREFGAEGTKPTDKLTIKKKDLAEKKTEVVILEPVV